MINSVKLAYGTGAGELGHISINGLGILKVGATKS